MKTSAPLARSPRRHAQSGAALIIVLFVMILLLGVVVAFLGSVQTERVTATNFLSTSQVRQMVDSTVGIVETQISNAAGKTDTAGGTEAWVSQPGMVRAYNSTGALDTAYKLYSATTLSTTDPTTLAADLPPANWASSPAAWSDLNSPVTDNGITTYPIVDPSGLGTIQGFSINANAPGVTTAQPVPMPVRWLYMLKDGSIISPTSSSGNTATFTGANAPTAANPITGRIAFWTDDETCKVNVNTAGAGYPSASPPPATSTTTYWDTPHYASTEEYKFATSQPVDGEFQRYPGHPAMTSLSAVFPTISPEDILTYITPQYQAGGSMEGNTDTSSTGVAMDRTKSDKPLRASVDELIFEAGTSRTPYTPPMSRTLLEGAKFFLTAANSAPELNLLNLPRIACWPISTNTAGQTADDKVIAFCSTINQKQYYYQRTSALSPSVDAAIGRNQTIYSYLQYLMGKNLPGFGVNLAGKFTTGTVSDSDQILTEIWDYIRCTNLYDSRLTTAGEQFTGALAISTGASNVPGLGYVVPLQVGTTQGFGRAMTISELAFHFICTADSLAPGNPMPPGTGLLGSNDTTKNLTLTTPLLVTDPTTGATLNQRRVQLLIDPEFFSPSLGNITMQVPKNGYRLTISGLSSLKLTTGAGPDLVTTPLFTNDSAQYVLPASTFTVGVSNARRYGGTFDYCSILPDTVSPSAFDSSLPSSFTQYPFISNFVTVAVIPPTPGGVPVMSFSSGALTFKIETSADGINWVTSQTGTISPPSPTGLPIPNLVTDAGTTAVANSHWWAFSYQNPWVGGPASSATPGTSATGEPGGRLDRLGTDQPDNTSYSGGVPIDPGTSTNTPTTPSSNSLIRAASSPSTYFDVVRSMEPSHGDYRLIAGLENVPSQAFTPLGNWSATGPANALMHTLQEGDGTLNYVAGAALYRRHFVTISEIGSSLGNSGNGAPDFRNDNPAAIAAVTASGDFDNPMSIVADGAYINKPDEGTTLSGTGTTLIPYFDSGAGYIDSGTFFSPNRIMPGPGMFGSLPTHLKRYQADPTNPQLYAWRTLLFRRQPTHPDAAPINSTGLPTSIAPDHLLMDFFWMPTVEPYAISQPFSSAGKINMNYEIMPFTYIVRKTGLYAVLDNEKIPAVPTANAAHYKTQSGSTATSYRLNIDIAQTLSQFDTRFTNADSGSGSGRIFVSPTELCDLWLVPVGQTADDPTMEAFWSSNALTGDNMRERPYTTIIPRLTTKSNTYTVHYRVQALKIPAKNSPATWDETQSIVLAESRGSTTIERFLDPTETDIPDYAATPTSTPLSTYYHWRVLANRVFAP